MKDNKGKMSFEVGWEDRGTHDRQEEISATVVPSLLAWKTQAPEGIRTTVLVTDISMQ